MLGAGQHLLSLINDVLDLAKVEAGGMKLELSEVAIPEVLRSAVSMQSERASRGGVELSLTTEPEEITISADGRRVRQIVFNLVSNAVKFTPAEGRVDLSARLDDGQVEIAVADTGPGIAADELETIFEEFRQATDGKRAEGTGLGLPLSRKLVELHGGRLWVERTAGNGSTFRFTLPIRQEASLATPLILIVEWLGGITRPSSVFVCDASASASCCAISNLDGQRDAPRGELRHEDQPALRTESSAPSR